MNIAIIGAGIAGCKLYNLFSKHTSSITLFEKSRGTGGRLSTKYIDQYYINHGSSYIQSNESNVLRWLDSLHHNTIVRKNNDQFLPEKGINQVCSSLINKKDLKTQTRIITASLENQKWKLTDDKNNTYDSFDLLFITIPAPQVLELDMDLNGSVQQQLKTVEYIPVSTLMVYNKQPIPIDPHEIKNSNYLYRYINNSHVYNYTDFNSYVFHFTLPTTYNNKEEAFTYLYKQNPFLLDLKSNVNSIEHFWKYALVKQGLLSSYSMPNERLGICGDYFNGSYQGIDSSFLSSLQLYNHIKTKEFAC